MARPAKSLLERVQDGSFLARRHAGLLVAEPLPVSCSFSTDEAAWRRLRGLQADYVKASTSHERRELALAFQQAAAELVAGESPSLEALLRAEVGGRFGGPAFARFCERFLVQTIGRWDAQPLTLEPWQRRIVTELLRETTHGRRAYREALIGLPRKNGKSTLCSALALYLLVYEGALREPGAEVIVAASARDQARIIFRQCAAMIERSEELSAFCRVYRDEIRVASTGGTLRVISSDAPRQYGLNPSAVIVDELWAHPNDELYFALRTASMARERPLLVSITTAGWDTQSIAYQVYERGLGGEDGLYFHWLAVPDDRLDDAKALKAANPASWLTAADLERERAAIRDAEFQRLHMNRWTSSRDVWIKPELWSACRSGDEIPDGATVYVGVDASFSGDATAVAWAYRRDDGRVLVRCKVWSAIDTTPAHVHVVGGRIAFEPVEQHVVDLARRYTVREVVYDPDFFARSAEILDDAGLTTAALDQRSGAMRHAYSNFYEAVMSSTVLHDGDPVLTAHVLNAAAQVDAAGSWKVRKARQQMKIDGLVAAVIAHSRAARAQPVEAWVGW